MHNIEKTIDHIGSKIKYYRVLNKVSLTKLATEANISKSTLFGLEEGKSNPTISTLINISNTLNIELNELIGANQDEEGYANLTLISTPDSGEYKVYKLSLTPNELFKFDNYTHKMYIEILEGSIKLIDKSISLYCGDSIDIDYNKYFKAYGKGAIVLLKMYRVKDSYYIKEDIFIKKGSKKSLENVCANAYKSSMSRVIFRSTVPIELEGRRKYINYIELLKNNKESHYYIFSRYIGVLGGVTTVLNILNSSLSSRYEKLKIFLDISTNNHTISKHDSSLIATTLTNEIKDIILSSAKDRYPNIIIVNSLQDMINIDIPKESYIIYIDDLINRYNNSAKELSLKYWLYRVFEELHILKDRELDSFELKVYSILLSNLPKALYFANCGYSDLSIYILKELSKQLITLDLNSANSQIINRFISINEHIDILIDDLNSANSLNTLSNVESLVKDLNLTIEVKELLSPVVDIGGLYCYIFKS